jgi:D-lactate dehydrogenase
MKVAVFSTKTYDQHFLEVAARDSGHQLTFLEPRLAPQTCMLANGYPAICAFVNDQVDASVLARLSAGGTKLVALRCAGFNNVDLEAAHRVGIDVVRVPAYSPYAVAEHTVGLILALNRKLPKAYNRIRDGNFSLDGLLGFDLHGQTAGIVGTGQIGAIVARLLYGFGCRLLLYDVAENADCRQLGQYVPLDTLLSQSQIITLHCPLLPQTYHLINRHAIGQMRDGVMLINTSRGALVDTQAVIAALKSGKIGYLGLDVYEEESNLFFEDLSDRVLQDDVFARLLTFSNVLITGHQAFFTRNALEAIARVTIDNITVFERRAPLTNQVTSAHIKKH